MAAPDNELEFQARGGVVYVKIEKREEEIVRVLMNGPVEFVFEGDIS